MIYNLIMKIQNNNQNYQINQHHSFKALRYDRKSEEFVKKFLNNIDLNIAALEYDLKFPEGFIPKSDEFISEIAEKQKDNKVVDMILGAFNFHTGTAKWFTRKKLGIQLVEKKTSNICFSEPLTRDIYIIDSQFTTPVKDIKGLKRDKNGIITDEDYKKLKGNIAPTEHTEVEICFYEQMMKNSELARVLSGQFDLKPMPSWAVLGKYKP